MEPASHVPAPASLSYPLCMMGGMAGNLVVGMLVAALSALVVAAVVRRLR